MTPQPIEITAKNGEIIRGIYQKPFYLTNEASNPAIMLFCHGFPDSDMDAHNHLFEKMQNICARIGLSSLRFDFRGCGQSDGDTQNLSLTTMCEDMEIVYYWAEKANGYERFMMTAEGLGSVPALMKLPKNTRAMTFLWPVFSPEDYAARAKDMGIDQTNLLFVKQLHELDLIRFMNQVTMPALIQQGAMDERIPIEFLDLARAHFRNRRIELTTYEDGIHGLPKESHRQNMLYHYEQFIMKYT